MTNQKPTKREKTQKVLGFCGLCGKPIYADQKYDLQNLDGRMRAVCHGGCE